LFSARAGRGTGAVANLTAADAAGSAAMICQPALRKGPLIRQARSASMENRSSRNYTYRCKIGTAGLLSDRRRLRQQLQQRLRNRLQLDLEMNAGELLVVPYANVELSYDTRYDALVTQKAELGTDVFSPQVDVTLYVS
jgi:hypothetical protein